MSIVKNLTKFETLKLKDCHSVISKNGNLCIGQRKKSIIIERPPSWAQKFLLMFNGKHPIKELLTKFNIKENNTDLRELLDTLYKHHFLEQIYQSKILSSKELEFYDRQLLYFAHMDKKGVSAIKYQEEVKKQNILVLGCGGWGTWIIQNLSMSGFGNITVVDHDVVSYSNLSRQAFFDSSDVGRYKVDVVVSKVRKTNPHINIVGIREKISNNIDYIKKLLSKKTMILIAWTDLSYFNHSAPEYMVHKFAHNYKIPVLDFFAATYEVSIGPFFLNTGKSICMKCISEDMQNHYFDNSNTVVQFQNKFIYNQFDKNEKVVESMQISYPISIMSGLVLDQILKWIMKKYSLLLINSSCTLDLYTYEINKVTFTKNPKCTWCA